MDIALLYVTIKCWSKTLYIVLCTCVGDWLLSWRAESQLEKPRWSLRGLSRQVAGSSRPLSARVSCTWRHWPRAATAGDTWRGLWWPVDLVQGLGGRTVESPGGCWGPFRRRSACNGVSTLTEVPILGPGSWLSQTPRARYIWRQMPAQYSTLGRIMVL